MSAYSQPGEPEVSEGALPSEEYIVRALPAILSTWDLMVLYVLILFFPTNVSNAIAAGAAGITFWIVGALFFFVPCAMATAQLAILFPHEGSLYIWTHKTLGRYLSFFVGFCTWAPSPLILLASADLLITYIQGLNSSWLVEPWQQGLALIAVIALSGLLAMQRHRTIQVIVNALIWCLPLVVVLICIAGFAWLLQGHRSTTSFSQASDWMITWDPRTGGNFGVFGVITLGYLGMNLPVTLIGETIARDGRALRRSIVRHIQWGTLLVVTGYLVVTLGVLIVRGQKDAFSLFVLVNTVDAALGRLAGNITAVCMLAIFFIATVVYNHTYARFLLVAGIDRRLPPGVGALSRKRQPARAIAFQTLVAIGFAVILFLIIPYTFGHASGSNPANLALEVYFVAIGSATVIWAFSTIFLFVLVLRLFTGSSPVPGFQPIVPAPLLIGGSVIGLIVGIVAIIDTALNSWIPLINNGLWSILIVSLTIGFLIVGAITSMFASSEAAWRDIERGG